MYIVFARLAQYVLYGPCAIKNQPTNQPIYQKWAYQIFDVPIVGVSRIKAGHPYLSNMPKKKNKIIVYSNNQRMTKVVKS